MNTIAEFVKQKRKEAGLTQEEFAMRSGLGLRFVRELEQGKETVRMDKVNQALSMFGMKAVPGRKTDVKDAEWIADLVRHGLVKASFVPRREQRELREMVRYRNEIVNERARELNRIQAVLEIIASLHALA